MKQCRLAFILFVLLGFNFNPKAFAQNDVDDILYLKNGKEVHGIILELIPFQSVKIQTGADKIVTYQMDEIEKIVKASPDYFRRKDKGYVNILEAGYLTGFGDGWLSFEGQSVGHEKNSYNALSIRDVNGLRLKKNLILGIGIGYESYKGNPDYLPPTEYIPIFFAVRAYSKGRSHIQGGFHLDIGYDIGLTKKTSTDNSTGFATFSITDKFNRAFFINPAISMHVISSGNNAFYISAGYQYLDISFDESVIANGTYQGFTFSQLVFQNYSLTSGFITFRAGYEF